MNTLNTKDIAQLARKMPVYDYFGTGWPIGSSSMVEPVSRFGIEGVRTSRRAEGFGNMGQILDAKLLGIPVAAIGIGLIAAYVWPGWLKK